MNIETLRLLYFSPTETTKKVLNAIADGLKPEAVIHSDLTLPDSIRSEKPGEEIKIDDGLTIIGAPVYAGRVAPEAARRIRQFKADGTPAVLVVLYGNYPYRDAHPLKDSSPETLENRCTRCETCVSVCPTAAIVLKDKVVTETGSCIVCCACVKSCPSEARVMNDPQIRAITEWLWENYNKRKEPEIFLDWKEM